MYRCVETAENKDVLQELPVVLVYILCVAENANSESPGIDAGNDF